MANFFGKYLGMFVLLAAAMLWAGCSDADKKADKSLEQEHTKIEFSVDSKKGYHLINNHPNLLQKSLFDYNGILIKFFNYSVDALVYIDDTEKIAQIIRKETESFVKFFDSIYKKEICTYGVYLNIDVFIGSNGNVEKVDRSPFLYDDGRLQDKITEYVKQIHFKGVGRNVFSLLINFCRLIEDKDDLKAPVYEFRVEPLEGSKIRKAKCAVSNPTDDELKLTNEAEHDKALILKVIRQRTPGLRHIYNKHLMVNHRKAYLKNNQDKVNPNFNGTIVFQLNIDADGFVQKVEIQSSNTGNKDFDDEVKRALSHWKFPKLKSSVVATFPITFFENSTPYKITTYPEILI